MLVFQDAAADMRALPLIRFIHLLLMITPYATLHVFSIITPPPCRFSRFRR